MEKKPHRRQFDLLDQRLVQACGKIYHATLVQDLQHDLSQDFDGQRAKTYASWLKKHELKNRLPAGLMKTLELV
jgi:hypothetical protein